MYFTSSGHFNTQDTLTYKVGLSAAICVHINKLKFDNDNDVYFTLATSDSRIGKYKTENN